MSATKFFPGWKMTEAQHRAYFQMLGQVHAALGLKSAAEKESMRQELHRRAFGGPKSAKEINHTTDFDAIKSECLAITQPDSLEAQLRQQTMPATRLIYAIRKLANEGYIRAIAQGRFGTEDWVELGEQDLTMLRNTVAARVSAKRRQGAAPPAQAAPVAEAVAVPAGSADEEGDPY